MKSVQSIILAFWIAGTFVLGSALLASFFGMTFAALTLENIFSFITRSPWPLIFGILFLAVSLAFIFFALRDLRKDQYIAFDNPNGAVTISVKAVEDFIYRIVKDYGEIKELFPKIRPQNEGVSIQIELILWAGTHIPDITERIQAEVKKQTQSMLGIENIANVEIKVTKIETRAAADLTPKTDLFEEDNININDRS